LGIVTVPAGELNIAKLPDRRQTRGAGKAMGHPLLPGGPSPLLNMAADRACCDACLSHPEWFVHFTVRVAARDADVAQCCVAQTIEVTP
jgi:hypothetical protein